MWNLLADRVAAAYGFAKALGLAAPQVGAGVAIAIVRPPGVEQLILLNPVVLKQSAEADEQYERCLSFIDVRGLVPRSLAIRVQYDTADGASRTAVFEHGCPPGGSRSYHLSGMTYWARTRPGIEPIPLAEYQGRGTAWQYGP